MPNDPAPAGLVDELEKAWPSGHPRAPGCRCFACLAAPHRDIILRALKAEGEAKEMRKALEFYALEANWQSETLHEPDPETGEGGEWAPPPALEDQGDIARAALGDTHAKA